jgi:CP family cyanate transporter-like MFS transporter
VTTSSATPTTEDDSHRRTHGALLLIGILLIAANLRPTLTCVGPLIDVIRRNTGLSSAQAGVLNTLPLLAFAGVSGLAPGWARRFGLEPLLFAAVSALLVGTLVRSIPSTVALFAGTALLGAGIACGNVLVPALIKRDYPTRVPTMTGVYAVTLSSAAAVSSGLAVPIADAAPGGWRTALGCWSLLSLIALIVWVPQVRARTKLIAVPRATGLRRSALAWQVTLFMGAQSFIFYCVITWLPDILQKKGFSSSSAGWELFLYQVISLASAATVPGLLRRLPDQRLVAFFAAGVAVVAYAGLAFAPSLATGWVVLGGLGSGASLTLALSFFALRGSNAAEVSALSGMAQSIGYLIAASGPILIGLLRDATSGWKLSLIVLSAMAVVQLASGLGAGRARTIGGSLQSAITVSERDLHDR